jgi:L-lysine exporter family protein LysE/ArgO
MTTLALTWLNPGVYLDTVVLLGTVAHTRGGGQPWWFGVGAALGSLLWFTGLGFGARLLAGRLVRPTTWRAMDGFVAVVMLVTGARVLVS